MFTRRHNMLLAAVALFSLAGHAPAGHFCCDHCGCQQPCQKVCRLVCEEKKVEVVCWGGKCEEFCLPCPGKPGCDFCEQVCDPCDEAAQKDDILVKPHKFVWTEWFARGAKMHTRVKLMKKVEVKKVPTYKYVVEDLCAQCQAKVKQESAEKQKDDPPKGEKPKPEAK